MAWFDAEAPVLLALIDYAAANGFDAHAWQIPWALGPFFNRRGRWRDCAAASRPRWPRRGGSATPSPSRTRTTCSATRRAILGDYEAAGPNIRQALDLFRELGDRANEGMVLNGLAGMLEKQERYPEALAVALDALRMLKAAGHWWTQANLENGVGWLYAHLGQYDQALIHCQRALSLHRESGHRGGTADTLDSLGYVYLHLGDIAQAKAYYEQAIEAYREIGGSVRRGQLAGRARRRLHGRGRPRCRRDGLARGRRRPGPAAAPAGRRDPGQAARPGRGQPGARGARRRLANPADTGHLTGAGTAAR